LLQTVVEVAAEKNSTLVMPVPVELLRFFDRAARNVGQAPSSAADAPSTSAPSTSAPQPVPAVPAVPAGPDLPALTAPANNGLTAPFNTAQKTPATPATPANA
jgi:hypothetical protein